MGMATFMSLDHSSQKSGDPSQPIIELKPEVRIEPTIIVNVPKRWPVPEWLLVIAVLADIILKFYPR